MLVNKAIDHIHFLASWEIVVNIFLSACEKRICTAKYNFNM